MPPHPSSNGTTKANDSSTKSNANGNKPHQSQTQTQSVVRFRNYFPKTIALQVGVRTRLTTSEIERQINQILKQNSEALDSRTWMAPSASKRNWDIKRDFARKLVILDKKTEQAMGELIRAEMLGNKAVAQKSAIEKERKRKEEEEEVERIRKERERELRGEKDDIDGEEMDDSGMSPGGTNTNLLTAENLKNLSAMGNNLNLKKGLQ